ncbi:MAG: TolC family protein [bacterium]
MKRLLITFFFPVFLLVNISFALSAETESVAAPTIRMGEGSTSGKNGKGAVPQVPAVTETELPGDNVAESGGPSPEKLQFDLTDCVRMSVRNNSELRGAEYEIEESKWKLKEAQPRGIPVINYQYEAAPAPTDANDPVGSFFNGDVTMENRVKVEVGFPITSFGKIHTAQQLAKEGITASIEKKNQKSSEIVLKTKQLYYGILLARDLRSMLQDASRKLDEEVGKRENSSSPSDPVDLAKLKLTRYEVLKRLGEVNKKEELAIEGLRITMGIDRSHAFEITDRHLKPVEFELKDVTYYLEEAKRYRPESKLLDIAIKAKEDEYRLEKKKLLPNLGAGGFFELGRSTGDIRNVGSTSNFNDPFNFTRAAVGLRLSGELNIREARARIRQKQAEYYKMSVMKDYAEEGLDLDVRDAYLSVKQTKTDEENAEKALRLARQLVFLTKTNYDVGVGDKKDYGDSLQSYLLMKARYYEAVFNYNVAVASLISKVGYQYSP